MGDAAYPRNSNSVMTLSLSLCLGFFSLLRPFPIRKSLLEQNDGGFFPTILLLLMPNWPSSLLEF
jgi:hypothetical protein